VLLVGAAIGFVVTSRRRLALFAVVAVGTVTLAGCISAPPEPAGGIVRRDTWGGDLPWGCQTGPDYAPSLTSEIIHHTASSNRYSPQDAVQQIRAIWAYHVFTLGYCDIAYNFIVDGWDKVYEGRRGGIDKPVIGAHSAGHNVGSSGIAMLGNYSLETPAPGVIRSLKDLMVWKFEVHGADPNPDYAIVGHNQVYSTECPGKKTDPFMPGIRAEVRGRVAGV
jgi:N-acetylmuramoyl-L-alanine amidase